MPTAIPAYLPEPILFPSSVTAWGWLGWQGATAFAIVLVVALAYWRDPTP